jgi:glycosyltransferase involved in cell wall biosynthesis
MTLLSVVIPAYNEEQGISDIVNRVLTVKLALADVGIDGLELLVVDDGSVDATAEIVREIPGVKLIRHQVNRGYGAALKTGFEQACGDLIGFLDADGTYPPEQFPALCVVVLEGADLVVGTRMAGAESQMPISRRIGNLFFARLLSVVGRQSVTDSASGMRVFRKEILKKIYPLPDGLNLTPVMSTRALHEEVRIAEVAIPYSERIGSSKLNVFRDGSLFLQSIILTALTYNPVRIFGLIGIGGMGVCALIVAGLFTARLTGTTSLGPWGVIAIFWALVSGVTGMSIFSLGVTFNYLVSLFYRRPIQQGLFGRPLLKTPLDRHFGWMGFLTLIAGFIIGAIPLLLGVNGWEIERLWLYLVASALGILTGVQLIIYWILLRALDELRKREFEVSGELSDQNEAME